jgi:hypothetical protein
MYGIGGEFPRRFQAVGMATRLRMQRRKNMVQAQKFPERGLHPGRTFGPDDPLQYSEIIEWLLDRQESFIGSSYYYIREDKGRFVICRMSITGGCLYSVDIIDHIGHGITGEDITDAVRFTIGEECVPGHYHIDVHIEHKLRTLLDA